MKRLGFPLAEARRALGAGRPDLVLHNLREAFDALSSDAHTAAAAGDLASAAGGYELANGFYDRALVHDPSLVAVRYNRAATSRFLGRLDAAEQDYDAVIATDPADSEAWLNRSHIRRQTQTRNHVGEIEACLERAGLAWHHRMRFLYALAKEREDLGRITDSFAALAEASALRRRRLDYNVDDDIAALNAIIDTFSASTLSRMGAGYGATAPIFVLGLPRSGTTLVERILEAHSDVVSGGEMSAFAKSLELCARASGFAGAGKHALIPFSTTLEPERLGRIYHEQVMVGRHAGHVIDKLPLNYLYIGLIAKALPNARIVHVHKPPMANGWGIFKTLFVQGYPFSYDQTELGRYIATYHRLMRHWDLVLPGRIHHVAYDRLVSEPAGAIRGLIAACGLGWEEACLAPHEAATANTSHSAAQIREPIHRRSVDTWKPFEPFLEPMRAAMALEGLTEVHTSQF